MQLEGSFLARCNAQCRPPRSYSRKSQELATSCALVTCGVSTVPSPHPPLLASVVRGGSERPPKLPNGVHRPCVSHPDPHWAADWNIIAPAEDGEHGFRGRSETLDRNRVTRTQPGERAGIFLAQALGTPLALWVQPSLASLPSIEKILGPSLPQERSGVHPARYKWSRVGRGEATLDDDILRKDGGVVAPGETRLMCKSELGDDAP